MSPRILLMRRTPCSQALLPHMYAWSRTPFLRHGQLDQGSACDPRVTHSLSALWSVEIYCEKTNRGNETLFFRYLNFSQCNIPLPHCILVEVVSEWLRDKLVILCVGRWMERDWPHGFFWCRLTQKNWSWAIRGGSLFFISVFLLINISNNSSRIRGPKILS